MDNTQKKEDQQPKLAAIQMAADLGNGRSIAINYTVPALADRAAIIEDVEKFRAVIDQQQAKSALVGHTESIEAEERKIKRMREDLEAIDERHARRAAVNGKGSRQIPLQEQELREAQVKNIRRMEEELLVMKEYHKKLMDEAGVTAKG